MGAMIGNGITRTVTIEFFEAQFYLSLMYRTGRGVPQHDKTAVKWYKLAAEQGYADAQFKLGVMYGKGWGVIRDRVYAHMCGNIAVSNGNEKGGKLRYFAAKEMTRSQLEKHKTLPVNVSVRNTKGVE